MNKTKRNPYFDFLRAFAIILVIANHTCSVANLEMTSGFNLNVLFLQVVKSAVPIFLAISGFFLIKVIITNFKQYIAFLKKHISRIYIPMMIFSLPFIFGNGISIRSIVGRTCLSLIGGYSVYYFIFLIAQYYALLPFIKKILKYKVGMVLMAFLSLISICMVTYFNLMRGMDLPLFLYAGLFPVWIVFFAIGCKLGVSTRDYKTLPLVVLVIISLILSYAETYFLNINYGDGYGIKLTVFIFSAFFIVLLFSRRFEKCYNENANNLISRILEKIGRLSFLIYLCHVYIINLFDQYNILTGNWYINILIISLSSICISWIVDIILPHKIGRLIGL